MIDGRLKGELDEVLDWLLHGRHFSEIHAPTTKAETRPRPSRLVVLSEAPVARNCEAG